MRFLHTITKKSNLKSISLQSCSTSSTKMKPLTKRSPTNPQPQMNMIMNQKSIITLLLPPGNSMIKKTQASFSKTLRIPSLKKNHQLSYTTTVVTLQYPFENKNSSEDNPTQRMITIASDTVISNNRVTTPITLQFSPSNKSALFNVAHAHKIISSEIEIFDATLKFITFDKKTIDSIDHFPSETKEYTSIFKDLHQDKTVTFRIYVSYKIEFSKTLAELKHGSRNSPSNILNTLVKITPC